MSFLFVGFPFLRFFFFFLHPTASIETQADTHSVYKCKTNEGSKEGSGREKEEGKRGIKGHDHVLDARDG